MISLNRIALYSYNKVYTVDKVYTFVIIGGYKGDDQYVDGTGYGCKEGMECCLR